jgi:hypothetical protein
MSKEIEQSKNTRSMQAGYELANCFIEMIHLMYQRKTALFFLRTFVSRLLEELERREKDETYKMEKAK